jgi:AbrB family looped-hinge helix DNA binding protein
MPPIDLPPALPVIPSMMSATMTSKGQITVPLELRRSWNLASGTKLNFFENNGRIEIAPERPASSYRGILSYLGDIDTTIPKEPDRF